MYGWQTGNLILQYSTNNEFHGKMHGPEVVSSTVAIMLLGHNSRPF